MYAYDIWVANPHGYCVKSIKGSKRIVDVDHLSHKVEFAFLCPYEVSIGSPSAISIAGSVSRYTRVEPNSDEVNYY